MTKGYDYSILATAFSTSHPCHLCEAGAMHEGMKPGVLAFRWLGVNGLEFTLYGDTLLVDPFLTRPSLLGLLMNRSVVSNEDLLRQHIPKADSILVTHAHYDHLMDVPAVIRQTGARAYGSRNVCRLLKAMGIEARFFNEIRTGEKLRLGAYRVAVLPNRHPRTPLDWRLSGEVRYDQSGSLRWSDFKLDEDFSFLIEAQGKALLVGNEPVDHADAIFLTPYLPAERIERLLQRTQAQQVIITHWEDFTRPLTQPLRPLFPFQASPKKLRQRIQKIAPGCEVIIPELFAVRAL